MNHTNPQEAAANGRDSNGRFTKNNSGGTGKPFARQMAQFRRELMVSVTTEDIQDIAKQFVDSAAKGSLPAAKLLCIVNDGCL